MQETLPTDLCRLSILLLKEGVAVVQAAKIELTSMPDFPRNGSGLGAMPIEQSAASYINP